MKVLRSIYPHNQIDYSSLIVLEGILSQDYESMSPKKFEAYYTNKRNVDNLLNEWVMPRNISIGFIHAYLEYKLGIKFEPFKFKRYVVQEDYFFKYKKMDLSEIYEIASREAIPCFKKHGFMYKEVE